MRRSVGVMRSRLSHRGRVWYEWLIDFGRLAKALFATLERELIDEEPRLTAKRGPCGGCRHD